MTATDTGAPHLTGALRARRLAGLAILAALLLLACLASLAFGSKAMPLTQIPHLLDDGFRLIINPDTPDPTADARVIAQLRFPRTLTGIVTGAALGTAGSLIQGHTRNPLADPGLLGVNSGAAIAVVIGMTWFGLSSIPATVVVAFLGAATATALVFSLTSIGSGKFNPLSVILGGAALTAVLSAVTAGIVLTHVDSLDRMRFWQAGSLSAGTLHTIAATTPFAIVGLVAALITSRQLNLLNLGDDIASSLGVNTVRARIVGMAIIALLAASAVATAGPIAFIGLVIPHFVRAITGPDYRWILPYSMLAGAILMLVADIVGRVVARPGELQVGVVLAFVGAPAILFLISRKKLVSL